MAGSGEASGHEIISKTFRDAYMRMAILVLNSCIGAGMNEVACLDHIRRKFFDIQVAQGSGCQAPASVEATK